MANPAVRKVQIRFRVAFAASGQKILFDDGGIGIRHLLDIVNTMTVRTDGRVHPLVRMLFIE